MQRTFQIRKNNPYSDTYTDLSTHKPTGQAVRESACPSSETLKDTYQSNIDDGQKQIDEANRNLDTKEQLADADKQIEDAKTAIASSDSQLKAAKEQLSSGKATHKKSCLPNNPWTVQKYLADNRNQSSATVLSRTNGAK
ncbi:MAG: hypothetical protein ACLT4D_13665 [Blautia faecis]